MPVGYWTGMSQPAKSTMRAPRRRCSAFSGVASSAACGLEGEAIPEHLRQCRRDEREPTCEEQYAHADHQRAAHALDGQHVAAKTPNHDERAVDGETNDQEWHAQTEGVRQEERHACADRLLLCRETQQSAQKRPDTRRPTSAEGQTHDEGAGWTPCIGP